MLPSWGLKESDMAEQVSDNPYVTVTWGFRQRVGCFILTDMISNSKVSDNLILESRVSWSVRSSGHSEWGTVRMCDSCSVLRTHIFPADLSTGFIHSPSLVQNAGKCGRVVFIFSVWAHFFFIAHRIQLSGSFFA